MRVDGDVVCVAHYSLRSQIDLMEGPSRVGELDVTTTTIDELYVYVPPLDANGLIGGHDKRLAQIPVPCSQLCD